MKFPFTIKSDFDLGERNTAMSVERDPDVMIYEGDVPQTIDAEAEGAAFQLKQGEFLLNVPDGSRIYVKNGQRVVYQRGPETGDRDLSLFILGSAWGAVCYQRGLIPIHASGNIADGKIVAFTGHSGAGKSTMAANLALRGYEFFTDDTLIFDPENQSAGARCYAGQKQLKLWGDAIKVTGAEALQPVREHASIDKHFAVPPKPSALTVAELTKLFVIRRAKANATLANEFVDFTGAEALLAIRANLYRPQYAEVLMGRKALYKGLKHLSENIKVACFVRLAGEDNYETALDLMCEAIGPAISQDA